MSNGLKKLFAESILTTLRRQAITTCSEWATMYRVMGKPFPGRYSFKHHPWAREPHDSQAETDVIKKAAQMGFTEYGLNSAFYTIDIEQSNVLYVLPASNPDASDFSSSRFDPALELSKHLSELFSNVKNVGHKRAGSASLFIRGSRSRSQMKSIPAPKIIFDEMDEMNLDNVILALERTSGQNVRKQIMISTPRIESKGIDIYWQRSTQERYLFKCPHCGKYTELLYPESLVITSEDPLDPKIEDSHLICPLCKGRLENDEKPIWLAEENCMWVPGKANTTIRGFCVSQLYSMAKASRPAVIAAASLRAKLDPTEEQEFYNSKLGECHTVEGARITDTQIKDAISNYHKFEKSGHRSWKMMGVDVGPKYLHVEITEYVLKNSRYNALDTSNLASAKVLTEMKVEQFEELDNLMRDFRITFCVVDAQPEKREAMRFAQRYLGVVRLCYYTESGSKMIQDDNKEDFSVSVGRTVWMDISLSRFKTGSIRLPLDTSFEYKEHIKCPVRSYEKDKEGNPVGRYLSGNQADHFAHSRTYSEIALALALSGSSSHNITESPI